MFAADDEAKGSSALSNCRILPVVHNADAIRGFHIFVDANYQPRMV